MLRQEIYTEVEGLVHIALKQAKFALTCFEYKTICKHTKNPSEIKRGRRGRRPAESPNKKKKGKKFKKNSIELTI